MGKQDTNSPLHHPPLPLSLPGATPVLLPAPGFVPPSADGCWAEGGTWTFDCEGKTGALFLPALVPLCCPLDFWRSQIPPRPPISYGPCSAGNRAGGGMCALLGALHTNYRMVI